ncbi:MAG: hypothetical protein LBQ86_05530, partial [Holophagales bacterium]|nr:hypothetical protein [Holophagales bacterium]
MLVVKPTQVNNFVGQAVAIIYGIVSKSALIFSIIIFTIGLQAQSSSTFKDQIRRVTLEKRPMVYLCNTKTA